MDGQPPATVSGVSLAADRYANGPENSRVRSYDPWNGSWSDVEVESGRIPLPAFKRSIVIRVEPK